MDNIFLIEDLEQIYALVMSRHPRLDGEMAWKIAIAIQRHGIEGCKIEFLEKIHLDLDQISFGLGVEQGEDQSLLLEYLKPISEYFNQELYGPDATRQKYI